MNASEEVRPNHGAWPVRGADRVGANFLSIHVLVHSGEVRRAQSSPKMNKIISNLEASWETTLGASPSFQRPMETQGIGSRRENRLRMIENEMGVREVGHLCRT